MNSPDDPSSSISKHYSLLPIVRPTLEQNDRVAVWRLPSDISQSRLGGRTSPSNACTLIALQLIELIERRNLHFATTHAAVRAPLFALPPPHVLRAPAGAESRPGTVAGIRYLMGTLVEAIIDGNEAHRHATKKRKPDELNFTIPDAIEAMKRPLTEIDFCTVTGSFSLMLPRFIRIALRSPFLLPLDRIHFVLIAFERTVLLVADRRTNSLIVLDSHLHGVSCAVTTGAIVATAHISDLTTLIQWMSEYIFPETRAPYLVQEFEISTVTYTGTARDCVEESRGGFSAFSRPPPAPTIKPAPIFTNQRAHYRPSYDKENEPLGSSSSHDQPMQQPAKKTTKRSADSSDLAPLGSSNSKRVRFGSEATTTVSHHSD
ncbi:hypothetical protein PENTCL1PPCAC_13791 [Pristionchus entomophagus]|uniref:Uncharacterized protein n=1 Tax=Pristionchus entomophagus TaxID=358040 RepID=A0AAV5T7Q4_9BILA|nr:hypothetical protein PENTCL1PPCAC_13791 [Pristionchus entomophagus]